jgi:hypothetical protein
MEQRGGPRGRVSVGSRCMAPEGPRKITWQVNVASSSRAARPFAPPALRSFRRTPRGPLQHGWNAASVTRHARRLLAGSVATRESREARRRERPQDAVVFHREDADLPRRSPASPHVFPDHQVRQALAVLVDRLVEEAAVTPVQGGARSEGELRGVNDPGSGRFRCAKPIYTEERTARRASRSDGR